ncbi:MAG TPA: hypothetical protein VKJ45_22615 [Blastocatellia bacterium]|nr:hypothetical protein [Blastocatellia bacterium]
MNRTARGVCRSACRNAGRDFRSLNRAVASSTPRARFRSVGAIFCSIILGRGRWPVWVIGWVILCCGLLLGAGCATKPFNVRPRPASPLGDVTARSDAGPLEVKAGAIRDEDCQYATFDANLILAGVLPVKVDICNRSSQPVNLKKAKFLLGNEQEPMGPRRAFKRLMTYYKIRLYNPEGYKTSLADFASYGFDQATPLPPGQLRWGILFFEDRPDLKRGHASILLVKGLGFAELKMRVD